ncbi:MAG: ATP-binding cassette domain-containing protein [bacterium]
MSAQLETQDLGLRKGAREVLKNISFSANSGEVFGIAGRSGSGKSSLLHLLCRLEEPSQGEIRLNQRPFGELAPQALRRQITMVFQTPTLLGPTVEDDLKLGLAFGEKVSECSQDKAWAKAWLEKVHLPCSMLEENPKKLSVGEAQRVALARAMAIQPLFLLLDEPTSALDSVSKLAIEETLQAAAAEGTGIILVSHDPRQLQELSVRGLELAAGQIVRRW